MWLNVERPLELGPALLHGDHEHDDHGHGHDHDHHGPAPRARGRHPHLRKPQASGDILVIRPVGGLSGDMFLAGLSRMAEVDQAELTRLAQGIGLPAIEGSVSLEQRAVAEVNGWTCRVNLPHEHAHRSLSDIRAIISGSGLPERAAGLAEATFSLLAAAEGRVHGRPAESVTFHEVGALDSILDICLAAMLFTRLSPAALVCGPLPLCDGTIHCSHGLLPTPAPAVLELLADVPVRGIPSQGETVTPTAIALLKGFGAQFGDWPEMTIRRQALVYGTRELPGVPNGAIFAWGQARVMSRI